MQTTIIVAMAKNWVIGKDGDIPWKLPSDLRRFKTLTVGHPIIMGRKTFDSIVARLKRPLPDRTSIVVSRRKDHASIGDVHWVISFEEAVEFARRMEREIFVAGGAAIYRLALPSASKIHLTTVDASIVGDTLFPHFDKREWKTLETQHELHPEDQYPSIYQVLERR